MGQIGESVQMRRPSNLEGRLELVRMAEDGFLCEIHLSGDEDVFAGHYPHLPILPGVLLLELMETAARSVIAGRIGRDVRLTLVKRMSFVAPVFPGDTVSVSGQPERGDWTKVRMEASVDEAPRAKASLLFGKIGDGS